MSPKKFSGLVVKVPSKHQPNICDGLGPRIEKNSVRRSSKRLIQAVFKPG